MPDYFNEIAILNQKAPLALLTTGANVMNKF